MWAQCSFFHFLMSWKQKSTAATLLRHYSPTRPWINLTPSEEGRFGRTDFPLQRGSWEGERDDAHPVRRGTRQPQAVRWPSTVNKNPSREANLLNGKQTRLLLTTLTAFLPAKYFDRLRGGEGMGTLDVFRNHLDEAQQKRLPGKCLLLSASLPAQAVQEKERSSGGKMCWADREYLLLRFWLILLLRWHRTMTKKDEFCWIY